VFLRLPNDGQTQNKNKNKTKKNKQTKTKKTTNKQKDQKNGNLECYSTPSEHLGSTLPSPHHSCYS
jgi:hypothetical protein